MINNIINVSIKPQLSGNIKQENNLLIWLRRIIKEIKVLGVTYWTAIEAYGEYSLEEGQRLLTLAETDFDEAFEIVASWEKEKSLPE